MQKFFKYAGLLIVIVFVTDRVLFFCISAVQKKTYTGIQGGKINNYLRLTPTPSLVIMGPSSPANQLDPGSFHVNTFNLGHPDTEDAFQAALLSVMIRHNKKPANILLHIDPYAYFEKDSTAYFVSKSPLKLGYYYNENPTVTNYINEIGAKERIKFFMKLTRYNNKVFSILKDYTGTGINSHDSKGFFPFTVSERDSITVLADYERHKNEKRPEFFMQASKMRYLSAFISNCKRNNINLILFTLPGYEHTVKEFRGDKETDSFVRFSNAVGLKYFDFRRGELPGIISKPRYWKDIQHLNALGSPIESQFVSKEISPFLR